MPFILAPAAGCCVGLRPITWAFGPITIQSMDNLGRLQGRYSENFVLIFQLEVCQKGGYFQDIDGSGPLKWRTWSFLTSGILNVVQLTPFLTPLPDTLLIEISAQNVQGIFLGFYLNHP